MRSAQCAAGSVLRLDPIVVKGGETSHQIGECDRDTGPQHLPPQPTRQPFLTCLSPTLPEC